ncbi:SIMPL domain-containing protein [Lacrimispora sp. 38-1]|uniref:SIMPL domain-containing protein n=1 Tax=Lacrimispora sp. 38-1 TaxID=3125778 RepID=UPI003CE7207C
MRRMNKTLAAAAAAATVLGLTACAQTAGASAPAPQAVVNAQNQNNIQVQSQEEVKVVPDKAEVSFAVSSQAADPKSVQDLNSTDVNKVIGFLKSSGIDEKSIQTSNFGLQPIYDWNDGQKITGYEMRTGIVVSDIPMDQVGTLLTSSIDAGINNIDRISYLSSKYDESYQEALKKAVESSKVKAEAMAAASGKSLGEVTNVQEISSYNENRYTTYAADSATGSLEAGAKQIAIEPGQISITAQVTVTYSIK